MTHAMTKYSLISRRTQLPLNCLFGAPGYQYFTYKIILCYNIITICKCIINDY